MNTTYLTDFEDGPPRPHSTAPGSLSYGDSLGDEGQRFLRSTSSVGPPPKWARIGSAAPVHEPLPALLASCRSDRRRAISSQLSQRNAEVSAKLELLVSSDETSAAQMNQRNRGPNSTAAASRSGGSGWDDANDMLLRTTFSFLQAPKPKPTRKSLAERTAAMVYEGRTTVRDEVVEKVSALRSNADLRLSFFHEVREKKAHLAGERRLRGAAILQRNALEARTHTPLGIEHHLTQLFLERDIHMSVVQQRKAQNVEERQHRFEQAVKRTNRTGVVLGDPAEIEREQLLASRCCSWKQLVHLGIASMRWLDALLLSRKLWLERITENERRRDVFLANHDKIVKIQHWMKRVQRKILLRKKAQACEVIREVLRQTPRIPTMFRRAVRRMLFRVVSLQRHFRTVKIVRQLRRNDAVEKVDQFIRRRIHEADVTIHGLQREKRTAEAHLTSAVKARKPIFEAQVESLQTSIIERTRYKMTLSSLTEASKRELLGALIRTRELDYLDMLREYGAAVAEKYMLEFNIDKVFRERQAQVEAAIQSGRPAQDVKFVSIWELKREAREKKRIPKPYLPLELTESDVERLFEPNERGLMLKRAVEDFRRATEQVYSRK